MSGSKTTSLEHLPSEVLSCICLGIQFTDVVHLYATNSRNLQRKLVSRGCLRTVVLSVTPDRLSPESRLFLRNHSNLESLEVCLSQSVNGSTFSFQGFTVDTSGALSDEVLRVVNPHSLQKLILAQNVPLATPDREKLGFKLFPLLTRFPQLKFLEIWQDFLPPATLSFSPTTTAPAMNRFLETLEGLETLILRTRLNLAPMTLPSTLTRLECCQCTDQNASRALPEIMEQLMRQCPSLLHLKLLYMSNGFSFGLGNNANYGFGGPGSTPTKEIGETPAAMIVPLESLSLMGNNTAMLKPSHKVVMPNLHTLVYATNFDAPILSDLLATHSLTFLSIGDPARTSFYIQDTVSMSHALAMALPATLTTLELGSQVNFPVRPETAYNFFQCLPRNLQILMVHTTLASYDWEYLPRTLEKIQLMSLNAPLVGLAPARVGTPMIFTNALPCQGLQSLETSLSLTTESFLHLPSSLKRLTCTLSENWDNRHLKTLMAHLPRAFLILDGSVRLTESPPEDSLAVDLNELAMRQLGPNAHQRVITRWMTDIAHTEKDQPESSGFIPTPASEVQRLVLPATMTSFTVHLVSFDMMVPAQPNGPFGNPNHPSTQGLTRPPIPVSHMGYLGVCDLVRVLSQLNHLTSITLDTPSPFPLETLSGTLPNLTYLDCGHSQINNFMPAWLPKSLTSFTALGLLGLQTRRNYVAAHMSAAKMSAAKMSAEAKNYAQNQNATLSWNAQTSPSPASSASSSAFSSANSFTLAAPSGSSPFSTVTASPSTFSLGSVASSSAPPPTFSFSSASGSSSFGSAATTATPSTSTFSFGSAATSSAAPSAPPQPYSNGSGFTFGNPSGGSVFNIGGTASTPSFSFASPSFPTAPAQSTPSFLGGFFPASIQIVPKKDLESNFPPNLTSLVIPGIPLLDTEPSELPQSLKTLSLYTVEWADHQIVALKNQLPNLTSFTISHVTIAQPNLPDSIEHVDWDILRANASSIANGKTAPMIGLWRLVSLPQSVKSLELCKPEVKTKFAKAPLDLYSAASTLNYNGNNFTPTLHDTLTSIEQLGMLPKTLTRLHISISTVLGSLSSLSTAPRPSFGMLTPSWINLRSLPPTLTDLLLNPVSSSDRNPFACIPSGVTRLALGFCQPTTCSIPNMANMPPNLVVLRAMQLMLFPCAVDALPKSLEDIRISGSGGWQDVHIKRLEEHIQPQAQIRLSEAELTGAFLPQHVKSLTREEMVRHTSDALDGRVTCHWVLSGTLALPPQLESLAISHFKPLVAQTLFATGGSYNMYQDQNAQMHPEWFSPPRIEPELCLPLVVRPLRHLTSIELFVQNFAYQQAVNLPPALTSLSMKVNTITDTPTLWSVLPRTLTRFQYEMANDLQSTTTMTHLDALPPNLLTLRLPTLKPSIEAIHGLPPSLTLLTVPECPIPLNQILQRYPNLEVICPVFLDPESTAFQFTS